MYETLQSIVDQLEFCGYQTEDGVHDLKMNAAFIALKEKAAAENCGSKTGTTPNNASDAIALLNRWKVTLETSYAKDDVWRDTMTFLAVIAQQHTS